MSEDPSSAFDLICGEVERQLRGGEIFIDASAAFDLLLGARYQLDNAPGPSVIVHGPLYETVKAARDEVYGLLMRLWHARREVLDARRQQWFAGQRDVRALLTDLLNVLLAAIAAVSAQRAYACAERRAMAAAVVAQIHADVIGVESQRDALHQAAADAIHVLVHGTAASQAGDPVLPVDVIRAEVARRVRGEVSTDVSAAGELTIAVRHLLDVQPGDDLTYGPLSEGVRAAREAVHRCLVQLWQARRTITSADHHLRDMHALLIDLEGVLLEAGTTIGVEQAYARAEQRAMAAAVVAEIRGDTLGIDVQLDAVRRAAADALRALQPLTTVRRP